ncbi:MAG: hypothetical protein OXC30_06535 [Alphaproteobacteria bacterium]|nr:hypothetical protein [Alphaproteobacteria bacterium]
MMNIFYIQRLLFLWVTVLHSADQSGQSDFPFIEESADERPFQQSMCGDGGPLLTEVEKWSSDQFLALTADLFGDRGCSSSTQDRLKPAAEAGSLEQNEYWQELLHSILPADSLDDNQTRDSVVDPTRGTPNIASDCTTSDSPPKQKHEDDTRKTAQQPGQNMLLYCDVYQHHAGLERPMQAPLCHQPMNARQNDYLYAATDSFYPSDYSVKSNHYQPTECVTGCVLPAVLAEKYVLGEFSSLTKREEDLFRICFNTLYQCDISHKDKKLYNAITEAIARYKSAGTRVKRVRATVEERRYLDAESERKRVKRRGVDIALIAKKEEASLEDISKVIEAMLSDAEKPRTFEELGRMKIAIFNINCEIRRKNSTEELQLEHERSTKLSKKGKKR